MVRPGEIRAPILPPESYPANGSSPEEITMTLFTKKQLMAMHRYCLKYRALVDAHFYGEGDPPTPDQDRKFLAFSKITCATGVVHVR